MLADIYKLTLSLLLMTLSIILCFSKSASAAGFFGLSLGYYNALGDHNKSAVFKAEYIPETSFFLSNLKPWVSAEITTNASFWLGGGILYDIALSDKFTLTPSFGAGFYNHGSGDIDLDYPIEFKSQIQLSYTLTEQDKIAFLLSHTSNAGLGNHNRGAETLALNYIRRL